MLIDINTLRSQLGSQIKTAHELQPPAGLPTGVDALDNYLSWGGVPQGELTFFTGHSGSGPTSAWIQIAKRVHLKNKWVAWINSDLELAPAHLVKHDIDLEKLLVVKRPDTTEDLFYILQEMISSHLFEVIGCHLGFNQLRLHQFQKLKKLARFAKVALIFIGESIHQLSESLFALVVRFDREFLTVTRTQHRPTPFSISGESIYANSLSQLTNNPRALVS